MGIPAAGLISKVRHERSSAGTAGSKQTSNLPKVSVSRTLNSCQELFCSCPLVLTSLWWRGNNKKSHISPLGDQNNSTEPPTANINTSPLSDPVFSDTCKIDTKFLSLNYLGGYVEPQSSKGCVLSGPDKDREVHIVELQAPNSSR